MKTSNGQIAIKKLIWALGLLGLENFFEGKPKLNHIIQEIWGNCIKAGFFNVIIQDIAAHGTND